MPSPLEICEESLKEVQRLSELNKQIMSSNLEKEKEYAIVKKQYSQDFERELEEWSNKYKGFGEQNYDSYRDRSRLDKHMERDGKVYSDCRIFPNTEAKEFSESCSSKLGEDYEHSPEKRLGCTYGDSIWSPSGCVDGCCIKDFCWGWKHECRKKKSVLEREKSLKEAELLKIKEKYKNEALRPENLVLEDYYKLPDIVCQDCSNNFDIVNSDSITADVEQINKCVVYLKDQESKVKDRDQGVVGNTSVETSPKDSRDISGETSPNDSPKQEDKPREPVKNDTSERNKMVMIGIIVLIFLLIFFL